MCVEDIPKILTVKDANQWSYIYQHCFITEKSLTYLSSSNLSKAAWGTLEKNGSQLMIRSYEIGVLLLPKDFDADYFVINGCHTLSDSTSHASIPVTVPFDLPVTPYCKDGKNFD